MTDIDHIFTLAIYHKNVVKILHLYVVILIF